MNGSPIDLTPFGFTPTEGRVFAALLDRGPTSAYALSKELNLARANTYQALNGLCAKDAAVKVESNPQVFRARDPNALLAMITEASTAKLDRLARELSGLGGVGEPGTARFSSERAFRELALRTALRADALTCVAAVAVLRGLNPIWRKRAADGAATGLWVLEPEDGEALATPDDVPLAGRIAVGAAAALFGAEPVLLLTPDTAIIGRRENEQLEGYWTSDPIFVGTARGTVARLTGGG